MAPPVPSSTPGAPGAPAFPEPPAGPGTLRRWTLWAAAPVLIAALFLAALVAQAIVAGARDSVLHTAVLLGVGDLTIQPEAAANGQGGPRVLQDIGVVFSNPALMRLPGKAVARVELRVEASSATGARTQAVDLFGLEGPQDPQAALLSKSLLQGLWPALEQPGEPGRHQVVLGAALAERLGLGRGDAIRLRAGAPGAQRGWRGQVAGVLRTGVAEVDGGRLWTGLASAQELLPAPPSLRMEMASRVAIYLTRPSDVVEWSQAVRRLTLPDGAEVLTWRQVNPDTLPWGPWQRVQRRADGTVFGGLALGATLAGALAAWAGAPAAPAGAPAAPAGAPAAPAGAPAAPAGQRRSRAALAWTLPLPPLIGLTLAVGAWALLWGLLRTHPLDAAGIFARLGTDLNPFGPLTGPITPDVGVSRALQVCLAGLGGYGLGVAALLGLRRLRQP